MQMLSERELELIHALQIAPRVPWTLAAEILDAHPAVLSQRWERLRSTGIVWIAAQPTGRPRQQVTCLSELACTPHSRERVIQSLVAMPEVFSIDTLSKNHQLGLTMVGESMSDMTNKTFASISNLPGVTSMQSSFSVQMHLTARNWRLRALDRKQIASLNAIDAEQSHTDTSVAVREEHRPILSLLQHNARCTAADVARATGLSAASARRQLSRVLHSDILTLRCDMAQAFSGYPVTAQWYARIPASQHASAAKALALTPNMRMVSTTTGKANMMIAMWLASVNDLLDAELALEAAVPGIELSESSLLMSPAKRLGWILRPDSTTTGELVAPPFPLQ